MTAVRVATVTLVVPGYDEAISYFVGTLGFELREDTRLSETKRWVRVAPAGAETAILLAQPKDESERAAIGNQAGGRVGFFLEVTDFDNTYQAYAERGVDFVRAPIREPYGTVAAFRDPFGNLWDLIEPARD